MKFIFSGLRTDNRGVRKSHRSRLRLSVIFIGFNMRRELPRSVLSATVPYQRGIEASDYEIIVVDNGSPEPIEDSVIKSIGTNVRYFRLEKPPASPAHAINFAVKRSKAEVIALLIDGAHMLTPRALFYGLAPFSYHSNPIVSTPQFFLGPGEQPDTVITGYNAEVEDRLLDEIKWPADGYKLFDIGVPYRYRFANGPPKLYWFVRRFESNCLFVRKTSFEKVGGADTRFDIPGGGCLLPDLCRELGELPDAQLVQLLGEATFHQVHGGVSTSASREDQKKLWARYTDQYYKIRGRPYHVCEKPIEFVGHMPNKATRDLMFTG